MQRWDIEPVMDTLSTVISKMQEPLATCIISKELVDSTFRYQRVIIESKQKQARNLKTLEDSEYIKKQIETLEQKKKEMVLYIEKRKGKNQTMKAQITESRLKMKELDELAFSIARNNMRCRPIPNEIMLKCVQEIKAFNDDADLTNC